MLSASRFRHFVIVGALFCAVPSLVHGQSACAQLGVNCSHPNTSSGGGGASGGPSDGGPIGEILGIPGDIRRAHDKAKESKLAKQRAALNDQGIAAYEKGDWATAEASFKECLKYFPDDQHVLRNLAMTQGHEGEEAYSKGDYATAASYFQQALANDPADDKDKRVLNDDLTTAQGKIAGAQQDKIAASQMQQSIKNLALSLTAAPSPNTAPSPGGLDFSAGGPAGSPDNSGGLTFADSDPSLKDAPHDTSAQPGTGGSTNAFGINSNPSNPNLEHQVAVPVPGSDTKAGDQLLSVQANGNKKIDLTANYDVGGAASAGSIRVPQGTGMTPGAAELAKRIPDRAKKDPEIQQSMAYYEKLDGRKTDTKVKLDAIQTQIESGKGDPKILSAQKATLTNDMNRYTADEADTKAKIQARIVTIRKSWDESSAPGPGAGGKSTP